MAAIVIYYRIKGNQHCKGQLYGSIAFSVNFKVNYMARLPCFIC